MDQPPLFRWRHYTGEIILCGVRMWQRGRRKAHDHGAFCSCDRQGY
jgi:hypothetical protein